MKLINSKEVFDLSYNEVIQLYSDYVNPGQVKQISKFGFGKNLVDKAEGIKIFQKNGKVIKDFTGGIGVLNHGHNHPRILKVRKEYSENLKMEVHKNYFNPAVAALSHNFSSIFNNNLKYSYFCNSGAESVEGACKMCYKYFNGKRNKILSSDISFHGKLFLSGGISNSPEVKFRWPMPGEKEIFSYNDLESFKTVFLNNYNDLYAVIIEPFNASSMTEMSKDQLVQIRNLTKKYKIPLIFDEVYSGWFKTKNLFNFMRINNLYPDVLTTSKSFGGGKSSIAAFIANDWLFKGAYGSLKDSIIHSTTYNGFGEETITALESINICFDENYSKKSQLVNERYLECLKQLKAKYSKEITSFNGSGSLWGIFFNENSVNKVARLLIKNMKISIFNDDRFLNKLIVSSIIEEMFESHDYLLFFGSNYRIPLVLSTPVNINLNEIDLFFAALDRTLENGINKLLIKFIKKNVI